MYDVFDHKGILCCFYHQNNHVDDSKLIQHCNNSDTLYDSKFNILICQMTLASDLGAIIEFIVGAKLKNLKGRSMWQMNVVLVDQCYQLLQNHHKILKANLSLYSTTSIDLFSPTNLSTEIVIHGW